MATSNLTTEQRLRSKTAPTDGNGCLLYLGLKDRHGYGIASWKSRRVSAHRLMFMLSKGPIPNGLHVLHSCDAPSCINPDHLFLGTNADNVADMMRKGRNRPARGVAQGKAKLTEDMVRQIRTSSETIRALGARFGVGHATIYYARTRATWRHVE